MLGFYAYNGRMRQMIPLIKNRLHLRRLRAHAGGIDLFQDRAAAEAYASGQVIAALRQSHAVRDVSVRLVPVIDDLSRQTRAIAHA